jgi:hypothetical protein
MRTGPRSASATGRLAETSVVAALAIAGAGLGVAGPAGAQNPAPQYAAKAALVGGKIEVQCDQVQPPNTGGFCHPEGTYSVQVTAAAKHELGISSAVVERGHFVACGEGTFCSEDFSNGFSVPAALKRFVRAHRGDVVVAGRVTITLTGPAGLPLQTLTAQTKLELSNKLVFALVGDGSRSVAMCTSNWEGPCQAG